MTSKSNFAVSSKAGLVACLALFVSIASLGFGQQLTGTLTGTTMDSTSAVVANAKVTMKNELSGDTRTTVSNGSGYFSITAVQPGSYTVTVTASGFKTWSQTGIVFAQGDSKTMSNISLQVGAVNETVEIQAGALSVPTDNAEVSTTLNQTLVTDVPILGRDAGELIKLMPGAASTNGLNQGNGFSDKVVGTNTGPVGSYSINGTQPYGSMAFMLDGANLVDPGNAGTQIANINQDMVSEVKMLMSSYSAEYAKGPVIFQAFSKSGGSQYHGVGYLYARNSALNSIDAYTHSQIANKSLTAAQGAPDESFYYIGGNVGGPILPHSKHLFFWGGYEYMRQHPAGSVHNYNVPTTEQRAGDFSETTIDGAPGYTGALGNATPTPLLKQLQSTWGYAYNIPWALPNGSTTPFGAVPTTPDPLLGSIMGFYPKPNTAPNASNGWNNLVLTSNNPQNRWEGTGKVDYAINDNTKITGSYTRQIENDAIPFEMWWSGPSWSLPYPSNALAKTVSQEVMANFTHVFSPTTTNEFVFTLARYINPAILTNPAAVDRTKIGFNVSPIFAHNQGIKQIPDIIGAWGGTFPDIRQVSFSSNFGAGKNAFGALKKDPSIYDNFTRVIGSHTIKVGAYWDTSGNVQSALGFSPTDKGAYNLGWAANDTGNVVADWFVGNAANYQEVSTGGPTGGNYIKNHQWSTYVQDSFKANRQLTLNYGLRLDHVGQWLGPDAGAQVWDPSNYSNVPGTFDKQGNCLSNCNPGLTWHAINNRIPKSGFESPLFYYEPRVGFAYDIFGTGKTVLRGGFAAFRYQFSVNDVTGPMNGPAGIFTYTAFSSGTPKYDPKAANPSCTGYAAVNCAASAGFLPPSGSVQNGATIAAMQLGDNRTPVVYDWNVTVSQAMPWRSVLEISYVANKSQNQLLNGANDKVLDQNAVHPGGYFFLDPVDSLYHSTSALSCNNSNNNANALDCGNPSPNGPTAGGAAAGANEGLRYVNYLAGFNANHYRPLGNYQDIYLITHGGYANYNSLQIGWQKASGPVTFLTNYTFGKVLGTRDGQTNNGAGNGKATDPFNLKNNYGPLGYDHTQTINAGYVWNLPKFIHGSKFVEGTVNGWQLSGFTTYSQGAPIQPNLGGNLNATFAGGLTVPTFGAPDLPDNSITLPNGLKSNNVNPGSWFGTDGGGGGYTVLVPQVTCDPRHHGSGLSFNPNCFTTPAYGFQGTQNFPYIRGPAYFDSDLGLFKSFQINERQKVQFRMQAINFLNHANPQFGLAGQADQSLNLTSHYTVPISLNAASKGGAAGSECAWLASQGQSSGNDGNGNCLANVTGIAATNTNTGLTGKPAFKIGNRSLMFSVKYYF